MDLKSTAAGRAAWVSIAEAETFRRQQILTWMPGSFNIHITYPNGLIHSICGFATPIMINNDFVESVTPASVPRILSELK